MKARGIARGFLVSRPELIALLPATRITAGVIPNGTALPAIGLTVVSADDRLTLAGGSSSKVTARIQITVAGKDNKSADDVLRQARAACKNKVGSIAGVPGVVAVHLLNVGPEFEHEAGFIVMTQDVRVIYTDSQ